MEVRNNTIYLRLRSPNRVLTLLPQSTQSRDDPHTVTIPWTPQNVVELNQIGFDAPSTLSHEYEGWNTGPNRPFAHQVTTADFLSRTKRGYCFNEQGLGKTASAIWAADYLLNKGLVNRVLVVCPLSIMDSAWRRDLFTFAMHRSVDIAHGSSSKRRKIIESGAEFVIINFDGVEVVEDAIANGGFDLFIIDEATHYKSATTNRWKTMRRLTSDVDKWLWLMTGTPAAQSPLDAYGLAKLVDPSSVPRFFTGFRDQLMYKVSKYKWLPKDNATDMVHEVLQPAIRFTKDECLDLPDMMYVDRYAPMSRQQEKYYKELKAQYRTAAAGEEITTANAALAMNKLLQISAGAIYTDSGEALEFDIKERYKVVKEVLDEASNKVLIFVPYRHAIEVILQRLTKDGIAAEVISGEVPAWRRADIFDRFQTQDDIQVLILQPATAAHGVTLTRADTVVWWGPTPSLEIYLQANARVHRYGQNHNCTVVHIQSSPVERRLYTALANREDLHTKTVDLYRQSVID